MNDKKTLDLGCGPSPRNPYGYSEIFGIDIAEQDIPATNFRKANLALEPIPFTDDFFDAVSAFDFIEHIPRQIHSLSQPVFRVPFVQLMNEIHRVLKPGGYFYALTPAYPNAQAFQDPTHVNIITERTCEYFCGDRPSARMYGFSGQFEMIRNNWVLPKNAMKADQNKFKILMRHWHRKLMRPSDISHILWEFRAVK